MNRYEVIVHHGVKGMHWGVITQKVSSSAKSYSDKRQVQNEKRKELKRSYHKKNAANRSARSAARTYYKQQRTNSFQTYRKAGVKLDRQQAKLTDEQVKNGRYQVARGRNIRRKSASAVLGTASAAFIAASPAAIAAPIAGLTVAAITNYASGGHYYSREKRAYGDKRAKLQSKS